MMPPHDADGWKRYLQFAEPLFVEVQIGHLTGWTGFVSAATAWCHWLPRMRSERSRLNCWPMDEAA